MNITLDDKASLHRLLTELAQRLNGAVDFWAVVCTMPTFDVHGFLDKQCATVKSVASQVQTALQGEGGREQQASSLGTLVEGCERLRAVFLILERFRDEPLEEVRRATQDLEQIHTQMLSAIRTLGNELGQPIDYLENQTPERRDYYQRILHTLFDVLRAQASQDASRK